MNPIPLRFFLYLALLLTSAACDSRSPEGFVETADQDLIPAEHGFLGVGYVSIDTPPLVINMVVPGSGAEKAGICSGDILVAVAGHPNPTFAQLYQIVATTEPGDAISLTIKRGDQEMPMDVRLVSFDDVQSAMEARQGRQKATGLPVDKSGTLPAPSP